MRTFAEKQAYDEGYRAYVDGLSYDDNPYNNNDEWDPFNEWELNRAWCEGYADAGWDD